MSNPTRNPVTGKNSRHKISTNTESIQRHSSIEFNVWPETLLLPNISLDLLSHVKPLPIPTALSQTVGDLLKNQGSRIKGLVNSMSETHYSPASGKLSVNEPLHIL